MKIAFGEGNLVVDTGTFGGAPAVFIANANFGGVVGTSAAKEMQELDALQPGEHVLTFPTDEQAKAVADALCGGPAE